MGLRYFLQQEGPCCSSLACVCVWEGLLQATLSFPNRLSSWEGLGATNSCGCELITLLVHSTGTLHTWYWLCSEGDQLLCLPLGSSANGLHSFQELSPTLLVKWGPKTLHSGRSCDSAPCQGMGNQALGLQNSSSEHLNQADLHPDKFPGTECPPNLVLQMSKAANWD